MLFGPSSRTKSALFSWSRYWEDSDIVAATSGPNTKDEGAVSFVQRLFSAGLCKPVSDPWTSIDPYLFLWQGHEILNPRALNALVDHHIIPRRDFEIDLDQMWLTPERLYYQENAKSRWSFDLPLGFPTGEPYEIARFYTPEQRIGIVRTVETSLTWYDDLIRWPLGDALFMGRFNVGCTWYLRLESVDPANPLDPYNYRGPLVPPIGLPGTAWNELPQWSEMRFLWGLYNPVYFILPPASLLSMWISFDAGSTMTEVREISGRFTGYTQAAPTLRALHNVTTGW